MVKNMVVTGIDASHWQGMIDWEKAAAGGMRFAFIKCCQNRITDRNFVDNWVGAKNAGLLRGAYCFGDYRNSAKPQADYFCQQLIQHGKGELPPALDIEQFGGHPLPSRLALLGWIEDFMFAVYTALGVRALFYTNPATIKYLSPIPTDLLAHDLWVAHYLNPASISIGWQPTFKPWGTWTFWQYTNRLDGAKYGVKSKQVDGDFWNGDYTTLLAYSARYTGEQAHQVDDREKLERLWMAHPELHGERK